MIPLVGIPAEFRLLKDNINALAKTIMDGKGVNVKYSVGTMIELPRAALIADEIAKDAEFFSFGTNDLTQTTFGFSRDDSGKFLEPYIQQGVLDHHPVAVVDRNRV